MADRTEIPPGFTAARTAVAVLCVSAWLVSPAPAQDSSPTMLVGERLVLSSKVLNEERSYWVHLPASYGDTRSAPRRYPVLYVLDGGVYLYSAVGTVEFMGSGLVGQLQIPELIVVGVLNTDRTRDMTPTHTLERPEGDDPALKTSGGGDAFLRFFRDELIPQVDRAYRTQHYRVLAGHSFGGLFAMHALQEAPDLFQAFVALDPSLFWDDQVLVRRAGDQSDRRRPGSIRRPVYFGISGSYTDGYRGDAIAGFVEAFKPRTDVRWTVQRFEDEVHQSVFHIGLYHGLLFIFEGYKVTPGFLFENASNLAAHFKKASEKFGMDVQPPEAFIDNVGNAFLGANQVDRAIGLFRFNVAVPPGSARAYNSLARAYVAKGEIEMAIRSYERSLQLAPDDEEARTQLALLQVIAWMPTYVLAEVKGRPLQAGGGF